MEPVATTDADTPQGVEMRPPTLTAAEAEELLAKRMFMGGCLFLPWLWVANLWYFYPKLKAGVVNPAAKKWIRYSAFGATIEVTIFFIWVLVIQLRWRSMLPGFSSYMTLLPEEEQSGGW